MKGVGTKVILLGPYAMGDPGTVGIDTPELLASISPSFDGYVWTNRIEKIDGWLKRRETR
jgi:glycerophosphoryl diester phosphodiesterase